MCRILILSVIVISLLGAFFIAPFFVLFFILFLSFFIKELKDKTLYIFVVFIAFLSQIIVANGDIRVYYQSDYESSINALKFFRAIILYIIDYLGLNNKNYGFFSIILSGFISAYIINFYLEKLNIKLIHYSLLSLLSFLFVFKISLITTFEWFLGSMFLWLGMIFYIQGKRVLPILLFFCALLIHVNLFVLALVFLQVIFFYRRNNYFFCFLSFINIVIVFMLLGLVEKLIPNSSYYFTGGWSRFVGINEHAQRLLLVFNILFSIMFFYKYNLDSRISLFYTKILILMAPLLFLFVEYRTIFFRYSEFLLMLFLYVYLKAFLVFKIKGKIFLIIICMVQVIFPYNIYSVADLRYNIDYDIWNDNLKTIFINDIQYPDYINNKQVGDSTGSDRK
ncbi:hypothetical protein ACCE85_000560 [Photobacterium damselae]